MWQSIKNKLNPNIEVVPDDSRLYWVALFTLGIAIYLCFSPMEFPKEELADGSFRTLQQLRPNAAGFLLSLAFVGFLWLRGVFSPIRNFLIFGLVLADIVFLASMMELLWTDQQVTLIELPEWLHSLGFSDFSYSPRMLSLVVLVLTLMGARAVAGLGVLLLIILSLYHLRSVDQNLCLTVFCLSVFSFWCQINVKGLNFNKDIFRFTLGKLGVGAKALGMGAKKDLEATGAAAKKTVDLAAQVAVAYAAGSVGAGVGEQVMVQQLAGKALSGRETNNEVVKHEQE